MKGRITVYTSENIPIFYNAECDIEYFGTNTQITYIEQVDKENQVLVNLGVSRVNLVVVRTQYEGSVATGKRKESTTKVLAPGKLSTLRTKFSFDEMDVFLFASGMKTSFGEDFVKLSIPCCFGNGELKTDRTTLFVTCMVNN